MKIHIKLTILVVIIMQVFLNISCKINSNAKTEGTKKSVFSITKLGNRSVANFGDHYLDNVQPIISKRCVVCHSCTNGPCQLNMTSYKAIERGINKKNPYVYSVSGSYDTRVTNNLTTEQWRAHDFKSILPGKDSGLTPEKSIIYCNLLRGKNNNESNPGFNEKEIRRMARAHESSSYECPATTAEYAAFEAKYPQGGMPCGLYSIPKKEIDVLIDWVKNGGQGPSDRAQNVAINPQTSSVTQGDADEIVNAWDEFLNQDNLESQLVSRYIYEHMSLANIHFDENPGEFYRIVRSSSPAPMPIVQIVSETVYDDPSIPGRVYYRMQKIDRVIEAKTHIAWRLKLSDIKHIQNLFFSIPWKIDALPGYKDPNPFVVFESIPARTRYRFMLENARTILQHIGKGPLCFTQEATYVIDAYSVFLFMKPDSDPTVLNPKLGLNSWDYFLTQNINWKAFFKGDNRFGEETYRVALEKEIRKLKPKGLSIDDIWDGEGTNTNAIVVGRRYQRSVEFDTVASKKLTGFPRSFNLFNYATFERVYYSSVARYKYWGSLAHKISTWDWQMYLKTEYEDMYISLYPDQNYRKELRKKYTPFLSRKYYWLSKDYSEGRPANSTINYNEETMFKAILAKLGPTITGEYDNLNNWPNANLSQQILPEIRNIQEWEMGLRAVTARIGSYPRYFPNIVYVRIDNKLYSLIAQRAYVRNKIVLLEKASRTPAEDEIRAFNGLMGLAPELFIDLNYNNAASFLSELTEVHNAESSAKFFSKYKIPRNSANFWTFVDWLTEWQEKYIPVDAGILELKFYDISDVPY